MAAAALLAGCEAAPEQGSVWPPSDFRIAVQEFAIGHDGMRIERSFRVRADGLAVFSTTTGEVVDPVTATRLPVAGRMSIYRLVPTCTRALARRVYRTGLLDVDPHQGEEDEAHIGARLSWLAFEREKVVTVRGRAHGALAEALAIVAAHMPSGEKFVIPGVVERGVPSVVRGVPSPGDDPLATLAALLDLVDTTPSDRDLVLDAFALACCLGKRTVAMALLEQWRRAAPGSPNEAAEVPRLTPEILGRMLPTADA